MSAQQPHGDDQELSATDRPSGGGISEDMWASLVGLALLFCALFGLIPDVVLW